MEQQQEVVEKVTLARALLPEVEVPMEIRLKISQVSNLKTGIGFQKHLLRMDNHILFHCSIHQTQLQLPLCKFYVYVYHRFVRSLMLMVSVVIL